MMFMIPIPPTMRLVEAMPARRIERSPVTEPTVSRSCAWSEMVKSALFVPVMPPNLAPYGVGLDEPGLLAFRVYVEKATTVGPSWAEVVFDRAIRFSSQ
jgi:hypothetical protein